MGIVIPETGINTILIFNPKDNKIQMSEKYYIIASQAARLLKINYSLLKYYIRHDRGPKHDIIAGIRMFKPSDVFAWSPVKHKRGRKPKEF